MSKMDPRIEAVREKYDLSRDDFWELPQRKGTWCVKHSALEIVAVKAGIWWTEIQIIEADTANGISAMIVKGTLGERVEWATGEASPKNNKNAYPWAMAEKRAKDRVVLKLVGIHGLVFSEDEMSNEEPRTTDQRSEQGRRESNAKPISAAAMKRGLDEIQKDLLDRRTPDDFLKCVDIWKTLMDRDGWTPDYREEAKKRFAQRRADIKAEMKEREANQGDGIRDVNGRELSNAEAG